MHVWLAVDAIVLKVIAQHLQGRLGLSPHCTHVKGHGGLKATVCAVQRQLKHNCFVLRTDVKGFYESIDHTLLLESLDKDIQSKYLRRLLCQYIKRTVEWGGLYKDIQRGISRGSALSRLLGAYYLKALDEAMAGQCFYRRYMDDIIILTKTRWKLRRAVTELNQRFNELKVEKHPDKTFIGRIERGFDFLGYHFSRGALGVAEKTISNFVARYHRLYEQQKTAPEGAVELGDYVSRWVRWATAGLDDLELALLPAGVTDTG